MGARARAEWIALVVAMFASAACGTTTPAPTAIDSELPDAAAHNAVDASAHDASVRDAARRDAAEDAALADVSTDAPHEACAPLTCTGHCGGFVDPCSGESLGCGACAAGYACEPLSHVCVQEFASCPALGFACGAAKDPCGNRIDCGECPDGQECDPDTNQCRSCSNVSCADLGYQCGQAWLGCGPRTNLTDCGGCGSGQVCNDTFNICEPASCASDPSTVCAQAAVEQGVECGVISNGCGGTVDCGGCPGTKVCGIDGTANECAEPEISPECRPLGFECGEAQSACGLAIYCGGCPDSHICTDKNSCIPFCAIKTCADYPGPCGTKLPDGCGGTIECGPPSQLPTTPPGTSGPCCIPKTCAKDYAGKCGSDLPDGCGNKLYCAGPNQAPTSDAGVAGGCCELRTCEVDYAMLCGIGLPDGCGGAITCLGPHQTNTTPIGVAGPCCNVKSCATDFVGMCGMFDDGCHGQITCGPFTCDVDFESRCGTFSNGCGDQTITCDCPVGTSCGAGGTPGVCGNATDAGCAVTQECPDQVCGDVPQDGGCLLHCICGDGQRCADGKCVCTPQTCQGRVGTFPDGCGGEITCSG